MLAGFAVDRVLTLVVLTPGAVGFTEAGTAAALTALGGAPAVMAAGVLLYRGFTYALEIPVGGVWLGGWLLAGGCVPRQRGPGGSGRVSRILHVSDVYRPEVGGIEVFVATSLRGRRQLGHDVTVLTSTPGDEQEAGAAPRVLRTGTGPAAVAGGLARGRAAAGTYDVVHAHLSVFSPFASLVARGSGVRWGCPPC